MSKSNGSGSNGSNYAHDIQAWREKRDEDLRAPDGWLSLTNLFILSEGSFTLGSAPDNDVVLPESAPFRVGTLDFHNRQAALSVTTDAPVTVDGVAIRRLALVDNTDKKPTIVTVGTVLFFIHHFTDQYAVRVKDMSNPGRQAFAGGEWFPVKPEYRVKGKVTRFDQTQAVPIDTIWHFPSEYKAVGEIAFELHGQSFKVLAAEYPVPGNSARYIVSFKDATSGNQAYGPVRFLQVDLSEDGTADVDFNKAVNPPCAFTPFATCPLAPRQNVLPVAIEAGELHGPHVQDIYNSFLNKADRLPA